MLPYSSLPPEEQVSTHEVKKEPIHRGNGLALISVTLGLVALGAMAFAYYYFFLQKPVSELSLNLIVPESVLLGDVFELELNYANDSEQIIRSSVATVSLPDGVVILGNSSGQRFWEEALGDLEPGAYGKRNINLIAVNGSETIKRFDANLRYSVTNDSGSQFRIASESNLVVKGPVIYANFETPQKVMSGQDFSLVLNYRNDSEMEMKRVKFTLDHPAKLELREGSTTPEVPMSGNNSWDIGALKPGATGTISIMSGFTGEAGYFSLDAKLTTEHEGESFTVWSSSPSITVSQAPLALSIMVNGEKNFAAKPGNELRYRLAYKNNSAVSLQNTVIEASLNGSMLDLSRLRTDGTFNSVENKLTWNSTNLAGLQGIAPGGEGFVEFSVPLKNAFSIRRISDKNFSVKVQVTIQSPTVPPGVDAAITISAASNETRISGDIAFEGMAYYYEPTGSGIKNTGAFPPKVNKPTQFTIHWRLKNSATDMKNVKITAKLPSGVSFTGNIYSTEEAKPKYNSATGEVSWEVPFITATKGLVGSPAEAVFQIEVTPSINQVDQSLALMGEAKLTAVDGWTEVSVAKTVYSKTSNLTDDPRAGQDGRVRN